jgi:N-acetylmuramoyl-L-alanine amidase
VQRRVFYLPEPFRLVIDVASRESLPPAAPVTGKPEVRRVVLDPGHGGHDPGAVGPTGLAEKDVTLDIAHRAAPLIARELGIATLLTRDSDEYVQLDARTARANAFQADLFVSIHCNAAPDTERDGFMTFVLAESGDAWAVGVAARENAASSSAAAELAAAWSRVQDAQHVARCVRFAELLQRATVASMQSGYADASDRGVRRAGFYVLAGARMPAVLFETSFISNPAGEMRLNTADYRQKLADAIVNAVRAYREGR